MRKKNVVTVYMSVFLLLSILGTQPIMPINASTTHHIYSGQSIQAAINSAQPGDTIFVHNGTYYEQVVVNKSVSLIGENRETTIIGGNGTGTVVYVFADNVNISRFTIRNSGYLYGDGDIFLKSSQGCSIKGNKIFAESMGIIVSGGSENRLMSNRIVDGLIYNEWYGIHLINSNGNVIVGNVQKDGETGIVLDRSCSNNISYNHIGDNNVWGIYLNDSHNNLIIDNKVGLCFSLMVMGLVESNSNIVYHNHFIGYSVDEYPAVATIRSFDNVWDDGYPSGGNYWTDHNPPDIYSGPYQNETGSDKIGDISYFIDENNRDKYPLIYSYGYVPSPDVERDGIIDIVDIVIVATAFGSKLGDPNWNPHADLNQDGIIDIVDLVMVAIHFGETW